MSTPSNSRRAHLDIDRDRVLDDEREVLPDDGELPDELDAPLESPEADVLEQRLDVPADEDDEPR
jgi:hypothetical protein